MAQTTNVNLRIAPYKGKMYLFLQTKGTTTQRKRLIPGIEEPDLKNWDNKKQCFMSPTVKAIADNATLQTYLHGWQLVNETYTPASCDELLKVYEKAVLVQDKGTVTVKKTTLGDFIRQMIDEQRNCTGHFIQKPSSTYQQYLNLLRKLELQGRIINTPIDEITNAHCVQFSDYILDELHGTNYKNLMKWFVSVHNKAVEQGRNSHRFTFRASANAPQKEARRIRSLSIDQLAKFEAFDLSLLLNASTPKKTVQQYELYRDFAVFLYEMKLRPIDTVKLTYDNIYADEQGTVFIQYTPEKKKNSNVHPTQCPMSEKAKAIVRKYKGQSSRGYIFPFALNEYEWDYTDPADYKRHYSKWNRLLEQINTFLHKLEKPLKFRGLSLYMFRHTAFTVACKEMRESYFEIAAHGGTSVQMLEKHYVATGYNTQGKFNIQNL